MKLRGTSPVLGGRVAHQVQGRRDAPVLLLLQGQANSHEWWQHVRPLLTERFLTITFDYRGTGDTARLQAATGKEDETLWSTGLFAEDAAAVLAALGVKRAFVYGTSMGGRIAQELAISHPRLVRTLVLACTTPGGSLATERSREVRLALSSPDRAARLRTTADLFYTPEWVTAHGGYDGVPTYLFGDPTMTRRDANRHLRVSAKHDAASRLDRIGAPTLILHGAQDRFAPVANATVLHERIRGSRLHVHPIGRHGFFDEFASETTDLVMDFTASA
ncbi:MAG TPA: alpha/beta hydrolase [Flexivirga sp.]|uniref:alpha/beta fold hydrolase n=1 Tax=Flexivirga sp. TaxID=1962927 RepID=UPI002C652D2A|nr:alpha/beta hydrolase [Flexivirga sp.]HWC21035.1 alpha/beta hydrolase [Flexivirga sp.]